MATPLVGIIMGSTSDWPTMEHAARTLEDFGVAWEAQVVSAHRTPDKLFSYATEARGRGLKCIIGGAGGAAHLPGMTAAITDLPVRGVPVLNTKEQTSDAPDHQVATYEFEKFTCVWEHRRFADNNSEKHKIGAYFYGTKGVLHLGWRDGWTFYPASKSGKIEHENPQLQEPDGHNLALLWSDFMESIDQRRAPVAGIELAHRATVLPLLGMVSWRVGRSLAWDAATEKIIGDPEANQLLSRPYREPWIYPSA